MPQHAPPGSRRAPAVRLLGAVALAGMVGVLERRNRRPQPITFRARRRLARQRRRRGRLARACFVVSALGAAALPIVWAATRPATDVGVLTGLGAARAATTPTTAVPVGPDLPAIRTYPARLQDQPARTVNSPVAIHIATLGVDAPVLPVGVVPASNLLEAPASPTTTGWYKHGPAPGESGSAVIAGHVDYAGVRGVFFGLRTLEPGTAIMVDYQDGSTKAWKVVARRQYLKSALPTETLFARQGAPTLTLVTCGGLFDGSRRSYRDNVVVFAVPD
jgi:hypothetical protein